MLNACISSLQEGGASKALMHVLRSRVMSASSAGGGGHAGTARAVLTAVKQFSANDEICREFADDGGSSTLSPPRTQAPSLPHAHKPLPLKLCPTRFPP